MRLSDIEQDHSLMSPIPVEKKASLLLVLSVRQIETKFTRWLRHTFRISEITCHARVFIAVVKPLHCVALPDGLIFFR